MGLTFEEGEAGRILYKHTGTMSRRKLRHLQKKNVLNAIWSLGADPAPDHGAHRVPRRVSLG